MNDNIINLPSKPNEEELLREGLIRLDDALSYFMEGESFELQNLAGAVYTALRYGELIVEERE